MHWAQDAFLPFPRAKGFCCLIPWWQWVFVCTWRAFPTLLSDASGSCATGECGKERVGARASPAVTAGGPLPCPQSGEVYKQSLQVGGTPWSAAQGVV